MRNRSGLRPHTLASLTAGAGKCINCGMTDNKTQPTQLDIARSEMLKQQNEDEKRQNEEFKLEMARVRKENEELERQEQARKKAVLTISVRVVGDLVDVLAQGGRPLSVPRDGRSIGACVDEAVSELALRALRGDRLL